MKSISNGLSEMTMDTSEVQSKNAFSGSMGSGIGNGAMIQHLDAKPEPQGKDEWQEESDLQQSQGLGPAEPLKEPEKTQGDYQVKINEINSQISNINDDITELESALKYLSENGFNGKNDAFTGMLNRLFAGNTELSKAFQHQDVETIKSILSNKINELNKELAPLYTEKYQIENNKNYDQRTYEDIRNDTAYQRAVEDMAKAGLSKTTISGGVNYGGGGGGSASNKEDEEKKKRKKKLEELQRQRELAELQRKEKEFNDTMRILGLAGTYAGGIGLVGSQIFRANTSKDIANINAESRKDYAKQLGNNMYDLDVRRELAGHNSYSNAYFNKYNEELSSHAETIEILKKVAQELRNK